MTVNEIIKLLNKEENKFGGATGKERELNLSVNGDFVGTITSAKLDGWGDGLITDVTLEVEVDSIKYHDEKIRNKTIDEFVERLKEKILEEIDGVSQCQRNYEVESEMSITCSHIMGSLRDVHHRVIEQITKEMRGAE